MLKDNINLVVDIECEIYHLIRHFPHKKFYDFSTETIEPGAVYLISREQFKNNVAKIREHIDQAHFILSNPAEASETIKRMCIERYGVDDLFLSNKLAMISGGDIEPDWVNLKFEKFITLIREERANVEAISRSKEIYSKKIKPYKFLFLNGRARYHRIEMIKRLAPLLDQALWSNLDTAAGPIHFLPKEYELILCHKHMIDTGTRFEKPNLFTNNTLFKNTNWGDGVLKAEPYIDTYFSVVTETVFEYPYSFRTEKIWKPIAMGHPWICCANYGFYRDIKNLGFKTFDNLIDESFDTMYSTQDRLTRLEHVIKDLCVQDLPSFLAAAEDTCKYNQSHMRELVPKIISQFPQQFTDFINERY
jgi:hypothetical protein